MQITDLFYAANRWNVDCSSLSLEDGSTDSELVMRTLLLEQTHATTY